MLSLYDVTWDVSCVAEVAVVLCVCDVFADMGCMGRITGELYA